MRKDSYRSEEPTRLPQKNKVLRLLTEKEARELRPSAEANIGIIVVIPRRVDRKVQVITITERNSFDQSWPVNKFPSGSMEVFDKDFEAAAAREAGTETDHKVWDFVFVAAAEYSSTIPGQKAYKVTMIAKRHAAISMTIVSALQRPKRKEVSVCSFIFKEDTWKEPKLYHPTEEGLISVNWRTIDKVEDIIPKGQRTMMQPITDKLMSLSREYWLAMGDIKVKTTFMEGVYHVNTYDKD